MGRKSKKPGGPAHVVKPTCFYCNRSFENEDVLISHQKMLHFRCSSCGKRFGNAPGMAVHMKTMHNIELKAVPKAEVGRDDPSLHIVGSVGVPTEEELLDAAEKKRMKVSSIESLVDSILTDTTTTTTTTPPAQPIKGLVYSDENISPEEKRALLPKYRFDESSLKEKLSLMDASIEARLKAALEKRGKT